MDENIKLYSAEESLKEANNRHEEGCGTGSETTRSETTRSETRRELRKRRRKGRVKIILAVASVPPACLAGHWISTGSAPQASREHPAIHASADQRDYTAPTDQGRASAPAHLEQKGHRQRKSSSAPATLPAARLAATNTGAPQPAIRRPPSAHRRRAVVPRSRMHLRRHLGHSRRSLSRYRNHR